MRPLLLDLCCGAGGAAIGYHRSGFDVVGVDIKPQPNYPFPFVQADALDVLADLAAGRSRLWPTPAAPNLPVARLDVGDFAGAHASPPCQFASPLNNLWRREHPNLIPAVREGLLALELPYVIENVPFARRHLRDPVMLCGSMFGLGANGRQLRRHRFFECSFYVMRSSCQHRGQPVGVYGHGGGGSMTRGYKGTGEEYREAMDMPGFTKAEIAQAIPPAYTEHIGGYMLAAITTRVAA